MSTPSRSNPRNPRAVRIIAWAIIVLIVAGVLAFEVVRIWIANTTPIIVGSVTR